MKNIIAIPLSILIISMLFSSCASTKITQIGKLNMISNRNVDSKTDYVLLKSYMGGTDKEIKKSEAKSIEDAIDETVKNTSGGEFLKNVKIYLVQYKSESYYAVEGDIWGIKGQENFRGFTVGDLVQWKKGFGKIHKGKITGFIDSTECMVKEDGKEESKPISIDKITKVSE